MKTLLSLVIIVLIAVSTISAQEEKVTETEFKVFGNCNMCKTRIEKAVKIDGVKYAKWNKNSKMLKVIFEAPATVDSLQKKIAEVGHDTEKYKAKDDVYAALPKCCLYRDNPATH